MGHDEISAEPYKVFRKLHSTYIQNTTQQSPFLKAKKGPVEHHMISSKMFRGWLSSVDVVWNFNAPQLRQRAMI